VTTAKATESGLPDGEGGTSMGEVEDDGREQYERCERLSVGMLDLRDGSFTPKQQTP
jgi:hypothetical protein